MTIDQEISPITQSTSRPTGGPTGAQRSSTTVNAAVSQFPSQSRSLEAYGESHDIVINDTASVSIEIVPSLSSQAVSLLIRFISHRSLMKTLEPVNP
jgi:hypothetical protein